MSEAQDDAEVRRGFATIEQIAANEVFREHFPAVKALLINALLLKSSSARARIIGDNPNPDKYAELGRHVAIYDDVIGMLDKMGGYHHIPTAKKKRFDKLKDPTHT